MNFSRNFLCGLALLMISCKSFHYAGDPVLSATQINNLKNSANNGDANAAFRLFEYYDFSEYNRDEAIAWLEKSARGGNVTAQYNMGMIYDGEIYPDLKDIPKAIYWFNRAAGNGDSNAKAKLDALK